MNFITIIFILCFASSCKSTQNKKRDQEKILSEGAKVFSKYGCMVCHSIDGTEIYGPSLDDIYKKEIKVLRNGEEITVLANREYIRKAITEPRYEKVLAYKDKEMPLTFLNDEEIDILVEYIVELSNNKQAHDLP